MSKNKTKLFIDKKILFIHYSCQNLTDKNEELSPRITSIAVLFKNGHTLKNFSIHYTAEILHITRDEIENKYDEIEKVMLSDFFKFAEGHYDHIWLHWNMKNINYGFEALEHRYKVLTGKEAYHISEENKGNLSKLIINKYGANCIDNPKMRNLMELNGGIHRDYLSGPDEVKAFENKDYFKMHSSTMCKVYWFSFIYNLLTMNKIKTKKINLKLFMSTIFNHPIVQILSIIAMILSITSGIHFLYNFLLRK